MIDFSFFILNLSNINKAYANITLAVKKALRRQKCFLFRQESAGNL
jgi:hypothetical protein